MDLAFFSIPSNVPFAFFKYLLKNSFFVFLLNFFNTISMYYVCDLVFETNLLGGVGVEFFLKTIIFLTNKLE